MFSTFICINITTYPSHTNKKVVLNLQIITINNTSQKKVFSKALLLDTNFVAIY